MNTKQIGEISEALMMAKFLELGWIVLKPFGDNQRYDLVIDKGNGFEKVQVKTGHLKNGVIRFATVSSYVHRKNGTKNYKGQCDYFGIYCPANKKCYLIKVNDSTMSQGSLRIELPKNKQVKNITMASNYEI